MKRWIFLMFSCLAFFTSEVFVDQTAPLVSRLSGTAAACTDGTDTACLDFSATQFNGLYVAHFWAGGVAALFTGFFITRYGIWVTSCTTAGLHLIGLILFTVGPYFSSTTAAFWVMLLGRLIFSVGYFGQLVLSHEVKSYWFFGREMALAFAIYMSSGRSGAIFSLAAIGEIVQKVGLQNTLWITFAITLVAPVSSILAGWFYGKHASTSIDATIFADRSEAGLYGFRKITQLGREFWVIAAMIFFFFGALFTALADFPKFLTQIFGYSEAAAGQVTGIMPDIAITAPIFGYLIDRYGGRDIWNVTAGGLFFLGFLGIAAIPGFDPVITCVFVAISWAILTAGMWGSIPVVTATRVVGVAMGVGTGTQALGSGLMLLLTGFILDDTSVPIANRWKNFFILVATFAGVCWLLTGISMYLDMKNPLRPLRVKHTVPAVVAEMNPDVNEYVPDENSPLIEKGEKTAEKVDF